MNKEIKRKIRELNKLKRQCPVGTEERRDILRKIREVKKQLTPIQTDAEKEELINKICKLDAWYNKRRNNLYKFTNEQLKKHLEIKK